MDWSVEFLTLDDRDLSQIWQGLSDKTADHTPFHTYEMTHAWWHAYGTNSECRAAVVLDPHGEPRLLLPVRIDDSAVGTPFTNAADYTGCVGASDRPAAHILLNHLSTAFSGLSLRLWNVPDSDPLADLVHRQEGAMTVASVRTHAVDHRCMGGLRGAYPIGPGFRRQVHKDRRRLERLGARTIDVRGEGVAAHVDDMFRIHRARRQALGHHGKFADGRRRDLVRSLTAIGAAFPCRYTALVIDDEPIAYRFGFLHKDTEYFWSSGFLPEVAPYSPGQVLLLHDTSILRAPTVIGAQPADPTTNPSLARIDFLRGDEPYKRHWCTSTRTVSTYELSLP